MSGKGQDIISKGMSILGREDPRGGEGFERSERQSTRLARLRQMVSRKSRNSRERMGGKAFFNGAITGDPYDDLKGNEEG